MTFRSELLPAPFGPMIARTSCSRTSKVMSASALTPPKASEMLSSLRTTSPTVRPTTLIATPFAPKGRGAGGPPLGAAQRRSCKRGGPLLCGLFRLCGKRFRLGDHQIGPHVARAAILEFHQRFDVL